ncbi:MAG: type II toxin-antitoxin system HicB family antitoxin [Eubacteriales bacterium]|nr:MAG: pilus assembly protein HicB [Firmicutes bacterium HGW-Firmicutes-8]
MDRYLFPAIIEPGERKGYCVTFPDLPGCITEGDTLEETLYMAKEALELHLYSMEEECDPIPKSTAPEKVKVPKGGFVTIIEAWMDLIRDQVANKAVKKTLTIPKWLNDLAEREKINFSHVLQHALKRRLNVFVVAGSTPELEMIAKIAKDPVSVELVKKDHSSKKQKERA